VDQVIVVTLIGAFGVLVTAHVALCVALVPKKGWWALVAFLVPPLAPHFGKKEGLRGITVVWLLGFSVYVVALAAGAL
jgi:hypothetical protein